MAPNRLRRPGGTIAAIASVALLAPIVASGPTVSQAASRKPLYDTLANHPEWRVPLSGPTVTAQVADLKEALTARGIGYGANTITAYRVPTVEGWTTYVTAAPDTIMVRPNPDLLERTPEGVRRLAVTDVAVNYGADPDAMAVIEAVQEVAAEYTTGSDIDLAATLTQVKNLIGPLDVSGIDATVTQLSALVEQVRAAGYDQAMNSISRIKAATERPLPDPNAIVQQIIDNVGPLDLTGVDETVTAAEEIVTSLDIMGRIGKLITMVRSIEPMDYVNQLKALVDGLPIPSVDPNQIMESITRLVANIELADSGLLKMDASPGALLFEATPVAVAAPPTSVMDNVMVNTFLAADGAREGNDGSATYWFVPEGAKNCATVANDAFERIVCWRIEAQAYDNDSNYNFWQLHADVSGASAGYRKLDRMWTEVRPAKSPEGRISQSWDQLPLPNASFGGSEGCQTGGQAFSIASGAPVEVGFSFYWERTSCERYQPKSYNEGGHWASIWQGNPKIPSGERRAVMLKAPVKTPSDTGVSWEIWAGQHTVS